jgi:protein tyrosine/serine phosphatase
MKVYAILLFLMIGCWLPLYAMELDRLSLSSGNRPHPNCYWVLPGRLLAGEYPKRDKLKQCLDAGITFFIDLTEKKTSYIEKHQAKVRKQGKAIEYCSMPIKDNSTPTPAFMKKILDTIDGALEHGHRVYVHCRAGVGRTGTVIGCYLVRHGMTGLQALKHLAQLWSTVKKAKRVHRSPERKGQREFIRNYHETLS